MEKIDRSGNRIMEFYLSATQCEFKGCESLAKFHCADGTSYKVGCGRVYCLEHSNKREDDVKGEDDLCRLCSDCEEQFRQEAIAWRVYCCLSIISIFVSMMFIWRIVVSVILASES